jgi:exonuclease SbcD
MRFIHAADIHLDSPLHGLANYPDAPVDVLRTSTRRAFENLVTRAIEEQVDFMVIAGDLYDGTWRDHNTGIQFCKQMGRLRTKGIPAYVLFGNHDAESEMTRKLELPDNVHCFGTRKAESFRLEHLRVALHGHSFKEKATTDNLVPGYPAPVAGWFNIGVLHTALEGNARHASYAPCTLQELAAKGYDYWALGHVHEHAVLMESPKVVFPGNLQGRNIREQGPRGAVLVEVDDSGRMEMERLLVDVLRWKTLEVDVSSCQDLPEVSRHVGREIESFRQQMGPLPHAVRIALTGKTQAHGQLFGLGAQLREQILAQLAALDSEDFWLEKVEVQTSSPVDESSYLLRSDALADLHAIIGEAAHDSDFMAGLTAELEQILKKGPPELIDEAPALQALRDGRLHELLAVVGPGLLDYLAEGEKS